MTQIWVQIFNFLMYQLIIILSNVCIIVRAKFLLALFYIYFNFTSFFLRVKKI